MLTGKFTFLRALVPEEKERRIQRQLKSREIDVEEYIKLTLGPSLVISIAVTGLLFPSQSLFALGYGLVTFSILYFLAMRLPQWIQKRYESNLERSMARALRTIATELRVRTPFHKCMEHAAGEDTAAGRELERVQREVKRGSSYPEALAKMSERNSMKFMRRTAGQLISVHSGDPIEGSEALKKLAREQESIQRARMEEYNQRLVLYSLIFIATSAVLPAMFQALVIIGSSFLNLSITPLQALLIPAVGFPALNLGIFTYVTLKKP